MYKASTAGGQDRNVRPALERELGVQEVAAILLERTMLALSHERLARGDAMNDQTPGGTSPLSWMLYFLAGGVTGASLALLLAPQSGRVTRQRMQRKLSDTAGSARDLKHQLIRRGQKIRDEARHRVDDAVSALTGDGAANLAG